MKRYITGVLCFLLPSFFLRHVLRLLGHRVGRKAKIGFSFLLVTKIEIHDSVRIGHFNLILNEKLVLYDKSIIGYLNILKGPFTLVLYTKAALGNKNYITRAPNGITYGESYLTLGELTKVTTGHHLDLTRSVTFGDFSILAGIRSQIWTHGYYHAAHGKDRIRIDGEIRIGNNVYIGSGCILNPGVKVADSVHIGSGSVISKNLLKQGMYVSQGLRHIENNLDKIKSKLKRVNNNDLLEEVYTKE